MSVIEGTAHDAIRIDAWRSVFEKVNRILSEQRVSVHVVGDENMPYGMAEIPAWSDGLDIFLNGEKVREMLKSNDPLAAVLRLKGLNYHELCHVLYTPRATDDMVRRLKEKVAQTGDTRWWYSFNALEDQRIETWFSTTYETSKRYFEATVLEWIIKNGSAEAAILLYGRKYLSPNIRVQVGRVFRKKYGKRLYDEFKTVIDEYITLVLPTDSVKAMTLLQRFMELLDQMQKAGGTLPVLVIMDNGGNGSSDCGGGMDGSGVPRQGRILVKAARSAAEAAKDAIEDAIDADIVEEARRDAADASGEGQGAGQSDSQGADASGTDGKNDADSNGAEGGKADTDAEGAGGGGASSSGTADHTVQQGDLKDEFDQMIDQAQQDMDEVANDEHVQQDVEAMYDAVQAVVQNGRMNAAGAATKTAERKASETEALVVRKVHNILLRIRQEGEPETLRKQYHGRIEPRRLIARQPHEVDVFKTWDTGTEDETGVEAVLLVDVSGSMSGALTEASGVCWALKRAFDRLDIRTTILMYDTNHTVLYQPSEKARGNVPVLGTGGGTDPTSALKQARLILSKSHQANKVLVTVTDGAWQGDEAPRLRIMKDLNKMGVTTMLLGMGRARSRYGKHGHQDGHDITSISELPRVVTKMVANIMRNAVMH